MLSHTSCRCGRTVNIMRRNVSSMFRSAFYFFVIGCYVVFSEAFNTDTSSPIIRRGPEGSYFGYSLAMHREGDENMLLVGAPKAQTPQPDVNAGGAIYRCPVSSFSLPDQCQQVTLDTTGNDLENGDQIANKSGQMFGATVQSGGPNGPVVVCRPLYTWFVHGASTPITLRNLVGGCFIAQNNFTNITEYTPCWNVDAIDTWQCQLGISAAVTQDEILLGAVGGFKAKGQVHLLDLYDDISPYSSDEPSNLQNSDYKGYSVAFGDFDHDGYNEYVAGIPRAALNNGTVSIMDAGLYEIRNIPGTQMGANFGHSIVSSDFNGDGYDDLVVSAPMYMDQEDNVLRYDVGRVYVYHNDKTGRFRTPQVLRGRKQGAMFGFSLAALGDINKDGFNDLAIGAPHDGVTGLGKVYIYHSKGHQGISQFPSQVIDPVDLELNWPTFGFSLSGGMDMDGNEYPDLAVGIYKASAVALFRSRPIVEITSHLSVDVPGITLTQRNYQLQNGALVFGFNVTLCLSFSGRSVPNEIDINYDLFADAGLPVTQRCYFDLIGEVNVEVVRNSVTLRSGIELCLDHTAYIANAIQDKLTPVKMQVNYALAAEWNETSFDSANVQPILDNKSVAASTITVPILRNCENNTCVPDLRLSVTRNIDTLYVGATYKVVLEVAITNGGEDAYQSKLRIHTPTELLFVRAQQRSPSRDLIATCSNDAQLSLVKCHIGNPLPAEAELNLKVEFESVNLSGQSDMLSFILEVGSVENERRSTEYDNRRAVDLPVEVMASMELIGLSNPEEVVFNAADYPPDREIETENDIGPEVIHYFSLSNNGPSHIGQTSIQIEWPMFTSNSNILLLLTRASMNNGRMCTVNAYVDPSNFPLQTGIIFEDISTVPDRTYCSDSRGDYPSFPSMTSVGQNSHRGTSHVDCCSLRNCATITCRLDTLLATSTAMGEVVIIVKSRLWVNTLHRENYPNFTISSRASADSEDSFYPIQFTKRPSANCTILTTILPITDQQTYKKSVPFWIYIVAVSAGVILVILLVLILWKIGFFKRKKITPEHRRKMERSKSQSANTCDTYPYRWRSIKAK